MSKQSTLKVIEAEIAEGKLGIARDRLHGLVLSFPDDLALRSRLGDVCAKLGYPREAGRFWFLDEPLSEGKREAVEAFVRECGSDPAVILRRLRLRVEPDLLSTGAARQKVEWMVEECRRRGVEPPLFPQRVKGDVKSANLISGLIFVVCALAVLVFMVGIGTVVGWFFR